MIVSDNDIHHLGASLVSPFKPAHVQPASIDLTLDHIFLELVGSGPIDLGDLKTTISDDDYHRWITTNHGYQLLPRAFVLGSTVERVSIPIDMVGRVEGKSSLGRLGLLVHSTAGFCDPGFNGKITLEFYNLNKRPIILRPGLRICQISFNCMNAPASKPYGHRDLGSKYQGQTETTASRYQG